MLNCDNPVDTLLKNVFDFLDVNDLATINRISEDSAHQHKETITKLQQGNPHDRARKVMHTTSDGEKAILIDPLNLVNSKNEAANVEAHLLNSVQVNPLRTLIDDSDANDNKNGHSANKGQKQESVLG